MYWICWAEVSHPSSWSSPIEITRSGGILQIGGNSVQGRRAVETECALVRKARKSTGS